ncbi:MAG: hypothetical protein AAGC47_06935 [Bacteroidota bacterium]
MKPILYTLLIGLLLFSCNSNEKKVEVDISKHEGLEMLETNYPFTTLYSPGKTDQAEEQSYLVYEAYEFLSGIMGANENFYLLVVAKEDWAKNAYSPVVGLPEYYKGNIIVGAGKPYIAMDYEDMIRSLPEEMTQDLTQAYTDDLGELDMSLYFKKLSIHELTHNFQDPQNMEGFSVSRWLEEVHANMGLYAFYKTKRQNELKHITRMVDFSLEYPPQGLKYTSLDDFNSNYYDIDPENYGYYQMKFTKMGQDLIDSLGISILKPLNDFIIKYDESWKDKLSEEDFREKLATEVDPYIVELIDNW